MQIIVILEIQLSKLNVSSIFISPTTLNYLSPSPSGYVGLRCDHVINNCFSNPCINGTCKTNGSTYYCNCRSGFNGKNCETNIDDCISAQCKNNATCVDGVNDYSCDCLPGFSGAFCGQDIDECKNSPCKNCGKCNNNPGSYSCNCTTGDTGRLLLTGTCVAVIVQVRTFVASVFACYTTFNHVPSNGVATGR